MTESSITDKLTSILKETDVNTLISSCEALYFRSHSWSRDIWAKLTDLFKDHSHILFQAIDRKYILTKRLLLITAAKTFRAIKQGTNIASNKNIEFLIRLTGIRNISSAINSVGANENKPSNIFVVVCRGNPEEVKRLILSNTALEEIKPSIHEYKKGLENYLLSLHISLKPCQYLGGIEEYISCLEKNMLNATSYIE